MLMPLIIVFRGKEFAPNTLEVHMGRNFLTTNTRYAECTTGPYTGYPVTLACWFRPRVTTGNQGLIVLNNSSENRAIGMMSTSTSIAATSSGSSSSTSIASMLVAGALRHYAITFTSSSLREFYVNGKLVGTGINSVLTPSALSHAGVGVGYIGSTRTNHADGVITDACVWNTVLRADELQAIAQGYSPKTIRPLNLVAYWPLNTPGDVLERDDHPLVPNRYNLTVVRAMPVPDYKMPVSHSLLFKTKAFPSSSEPPGGGPRRRRIFMGR